MVLNVIGWSFVAATTAWGVTLSWAKLTLAQLRKELEDDIRHWHTETVKARELAAQLKNEIDIWSRGCQQGREDVISIIPLLAAVRDRHLSAELTETAERSN
jgi:hypothetical protein